jgi:hypothetical protein
VTEWKKLQNAMLQYFVSFTKFSVCANQEGSILRFWETLDELERYKAHAGLWLKWLKGRPWCRCTDIKVDLEKSGWDAASLIRLSAETSAGSCRQHNEFSGSNT